MKNFSDKNYDPDDFEEDSESNDFILPVSKETLWREELGL